MKPKHRRIATIAGGVLSALSIGGCSITPVAQQTTALNTAVTQFEAMVSASSPVSSSETTLTQARMLQAAYGGSIQPLVDDCTQRVQSLESQYNVDVVAGKPPATLDADYKALLAAAPCTRRSVPGNSSSPRSPEVISDLKAYFDALQAIATAKDTQSFDTAAQTLSTSITDLAKTTGGAAIAQAVPAVFSQLAQTAVQQAEYETLKLYVPAMDRLLTNAAPAITTALRVQQSFYVTVVTMDAQEGMKILNGLYAKVSLKSDPVAALTVYAASAPIVDEFETEQTSMRVDPAAAFSALLTAHHALAQALQSSKGEMAAIVNSVTAISTSAKSLISPPATSKAATAKIGG
ncbi:MAG TPA: hypothetical protein VGG63_06535 [Steroidobacteraceae bacterium]|jgi:hypothetical protein